MLVRNSSSVALAVDSRVVDDVDLIALAMSDGLSAEYVQLESSPFRGRWTAIHAAPVVAQFGSHEIAVVRRVRVPPDRCAFMVPLAVPAAARWNGRAVRAEDIIVCPPRSECLAFDPPSTQFAILTVGTTAPVLRAAGSLLASSAGAPLTARCGSEARVLCERLICVRNAAESRHLSALSEVDLNLAAALRACLERWADGCGDVASLDGRSRIVRRVEEFLRSHVSEGVSVAQLSTVAGVSERSLRNAFYDVYTTSPKRYMTLWQLHQVRRTLRSADAAAATVTAAATCHGFYELGRFAGAYKSLFGEAPSQTLSRAKRQHGLEGAA